MTKSPLFGKLLELVIAIEQIPSIAVLRPIVTDYFIWDSKPCKQFLQVDDDTTGNVLANKLYFKVL